MFFANVNGVKTNPSPGLKGVCYCCGSEVISKCGNFNIWHWAHIDLKQCDNWWENETKWHRQWKNHFPIDNQEIVHVDNETYEKHIADVKTKNGVVIEFQNSPISIEELKSRESFYGNMIWIVNGQNFKSRFKILDCLPNPEIKKFDQYRFLERTNKSAGAFYTTPFTYEGSFPIYSLVDLESEIKANYVGHNLYHWTNPRKVWFHSTKKVFLDLGDENLYELVNYKNYLPCIKKWKKIVFINRALNPKR